MSRPSAAAAGKGRASSTSQAAVARDKLAAASIAAELNGAGAVDSFGIPTDLGVGAVYNAGAGVAPNGEESLEDVFMSVDDILKVVPPRTARATLPHVGALFVCVCFF